MSAQLNITNNFEKLTDNNYDTWSLLMKSVLVNSDLWQIASGNKLNDGTTQWENADGKALATIILHVITAQLVHVKRCKSSWEAWEKLKKLHVPSNSIRKVSLYKKIFNLKMHEHDSASNFVASFSELCDKLEEVEIKLPDELKTIMLLSNLPDEYENFVVAIETRDILPKFDAIKLKLIEEDERRSNKCDQSDYLKQSQQAFYVQSKEQQSNVSKSQSFKGKCYNCGKRGHLMQFCKKKKQSKKQNENKHHTTHAAFMLNEPGIVSKKSWCVDSGATSHMCCDRNYFESFVDQKENIKLAAEHSTKSLGIGTINLKTKNCILTLQNVLYVPSLHTNFMSVSKILKAGHIVQFKNNRAIIKKSSGEMLITARMSNDLFLCEGIIDEQLYTAQNDNTMLWHARHGLLNLQSMKMMAKENMVHGLKVSNINTSINCDTCNKSKITALPFKTIQNKNSGGILNLIHSDVCGPMSKHSVGGARYFVTFEDDYSRMVFVYFIKSKNEVLKNFRIFKNHVECQTGKNIKILRSDNGKEYVNSTFNEYLENCGIKHELTVSYTPQQNGVAERVNRTLVEMARCMLVHAKAPEFLWAEPVYTAAYLRNRSTTKALENMTPYEAWHKKKPVITHLRRFGLRVFALDKTEKNKFKAKGKEYLFVGYSSVSKAYRLFDRTKMQIIIRRDVRFVENNVVNNINVGDSNNIDNEPEQQSYEFLMFPSNTDSKPQEDQNIIEQTVEVESENQCLIQNSLAVNQNDTTDVDQGAASDDGNVANSIIQERRRRGGRPHIERSGKPGRPRKVYHMINFSAEHDPIETPKTRSSLLEKMTKRDRLARRKPNCFEW